jgi:hypothetical protein
MSVTRTLSLTVRGLLCGWESLRRYDLLVLRVHVNSAARKPEVLVISGYGRSWRARPAEPLQPRRDLGVVRVRMIPQRRHIEPRSSIVSRESGASSFSIAAGEPFTPAQMPWIHFAVNARSASHSASTRRASGSWTASRVPGASR